MTLEIITKELPSSAFYFLLFKITFQKKNQISKPVFSFVSAGLLGQPFKNGLIILKNHLQLKETA
jgi:hypothetical protein